MQAHDRLSIEPCELTDANAFVDAVHRHHKPVRGHRWSLAVVDEDGTRRGIATIGRPVGRQIDQRKIVEVLRVATDGRANACSALYGASCRQQQVHGYLWAQTYTLLSEPGTSLRAAGWNVVRSDRERGIGMVLASALVLFAWPLCLAMAGTVKPGIVAGPLFVGLWRWLR